MTVVCVKTILNFTRRNYEFDAEELGMDGHKLKNMDEFAAASGVSRPTISKYFHDPNSVRKTTRSRIEEALERFDYRPNIYAMNQNRRLTKTIGISVPYLADPFFAEIARTIERLCIAAGYRPILLSSHGETDVENENLEGLRSLKPAGVLLAPLGRTSDRGLIEKFCSDVPSVLFDGRIDNLGAAFVGSDNDQSIDLIVDYLCQTGEPPGFFEMRTPTNPNAYKRHYAYIKSMEEKGHNAQIFQAEGSNWDFEEIGYREGLRAFSDGHFTSRTILCSNDRLAIGLLAAAFELGVKVGCDTDDAFRIAGHDDHPFSRYTCPSLTTVSQDYASIAERSVQTLLSLIEQDGSNAARQTTLFDGALVKRNSA